MSAGAFDCREIDPERKCLPLFVIGTGAPSEAGAFLWVDYDGQRYSIPNGLVGGFSSQVIDILRQQIAINSSAKSLPQASVLSVIGQ